MTAFILFFDEIAPDHLSTAGGKGLNLGRLARAGLPVPPGFVLTTEAFRRREEAGVETALSEAYGRLGGGPVAILVRGYGWSGS